MGSTRWTCSVETWQASWNLGLSHTRTVVPECFKGDEASQWKRPKFDRSPHQNPLTDLPKNWHLWLRHGRHSSCKNFVSIDSGVSVPQICDFAVLLRWLVFTSFFWGFFNKATAYTPKWIFTQSTSEHVVPGKEVPFGGLDNYIWYLDP